jgi:hypothetical protein
MDNTNDFYAHLNFDKDSNSLVCKFPHEIYLSDANKPETVWRAALLEGSIHREFETVGHDDFVYIEASDGVTTDWWQFHARPGYCTEINSYWQQFKTPLLRIQHLHHLLETEGKSKKLNLTFKSSDVLMRFSDKFRRQFTLHGTGGEPCPESLSFTDQELQNGNITVVLDHDPRKGFRRIFAVCDIIRPSYFRNSIAKILSSSVVEEFNRSSSSFVELYENIPTYRRLNTPQIGGFSIHFINEYGEQIILNPIHGYALVHFSKYIE